MLASTLSSGSNIAFQFILGGHTLRVLVLGFLNTGVKGQQSLKIFITIMNLLQGRRKDFWSGPVVIGTLCAHAQFLDIPIINVVWPKPDQPDQLLRLCVVQV